jgi:cytochrome c biogenesis protein
MSTIWQVLTRLASLRLTLVLLALLLVAVVVALYSGENITWVLVVPLTLVGINLLAAIIVSPAFRRHPGLMVFHVALMAILVLVTAGRLTYLKGHVDLATGQTFEGQLAESEAGPWHAGDLDEVRFTNEGFTIEYAPGWRRGHTYNRVSWSSDKSGRDGDAIVGDNTPLLIEGYRFYTSHNKGYAPVFLWQPERGGSPELGTVNLPSYPLNDYRQAAEWSPPGSDQSLWVMLEIQEDVMPLDSHTSFQLPEQHQLIVRTDGQRYLLQPGDTLPLADGRLTYEGLTSWMGYRVQYDWTIHWLFAAAALGIAGLGWHYWQTYNQRPWRPRYADTAGQATAKKTSTQS